MEEQDFVDSLNDEMFEGMDNDMPNRLGRQITSR